MTAAPPQVVGRARPPQTPATASSAPSAAPASTSERAKTEGTGPRHPPNPQKGPVKLKVVVRGLPPNLPEAVFKQSASEWINESTVDWYYYVAGKLSERSRAYAKFKSLEYLAAFHKAFNGHVFTDSKGRSSRAIIEFAPYQKSVKGKIKPDSKQGTIESTPEYKEFLETLGQPASPPVDLAIPPEGEPKTTTPLIEFLRNQKATKAEKERLAREKDKARKIAALQAKANAQSAKFRAEKLAKATAAAALNEAARVTKPETSKTANARGGRGGAAAAGGKGPARFKEKPKASPPRQPQQPPRHQPPKHQETNPTPDASKSGDVIQKPTAVASPAASISASETPSNIGGQTHRGGRGRGRARPHGIYRPGGRGGRRGGASGLGSESRPGATTGEG